MSTTLSVTDTPSDPDGVTSISGLRSNYTVTLTPTSETVTGGMIAASVAPLTTLQFVDGAVVTDPASTGGLAYGLFEAAVDRTPGVQSLAFWKASISDASDVPTGLLATAQGLLATSESQAIYGQTDNSGFVSLLYQNFLGRPVDSSGSAYYTNLLNTGTSRAQVLLSLVQSGEGQQDLGSQISAGTFVVNVQAVTTLRLYETIYGRLPDYNGAVYWTYAGEGGDTFAQIANSLMSTAEFTSQAGNSSASFVNLIQEHAYGTVNAGATTYWSGLLDAGTVSKADVVSAYAYAPGVKALVAANVSNNGVAHS